METEPTSPDKPLSQIDPTHWNDWHWQMRSRLASLEDLQKYVRLTPSEVSGIRMAQGRFPVGITPYWASLMDPINPRCPIRMQVIPTAQEHLVSRNEMLDPLAEDSHSPVPGLVHRYPDRVLLLPLNMCASYCRYCTRSRWVGDENEMLLGTRLDPAIEYLRSHKEIRDVLISGGDPLLFSDGRLEELLARLRAIDHIEFIRIGTRVPVFLPMRVTAELVQMMRRFHPLWISIHFNHPKEITPEVRRACTMLADGGFPLGSQSVLLKGINDDAAVFKELFHELLKIRVRPYYIYQCDPVTGTSHFRTPIAKGVEIIEALRGHTTGYAVPTFVVDAPGGGGKVPVNPNYVLEHANGVLRLRNYAGRTYTYHEENP
ncbi:MAG TPA: KamA family radical SAM protein [Candidatus Polarisedimenticolia bacterium]